MTGREQIHLETVDKAIIEVSVYKGGRRSSGVKRIVEFCFHDLPESSAILGIRPEYHVASMIQLGAQRNTSYV